MSYIQVGGSNPARLTLAIFLLYTKIILNICHELVVEYTDLEPKYYF